MSRRGGNTVYEERDYYREAPTPPQVSVRERDFEETDTYNGRGSRPAFLDREEIYTRSDAGPLVIRGRDSGALERRDPHRSSSEVRVSTREREIIQRPQSPQERVRTRIIERRSPSPPPERLRARVVETRERIRERSPDPPPPVRVVRERFVERERERSPSPQQIDRVRIRNVERDIQVREPTPSPSPSPPTPPAIRAPPIHQEIITHHRHIDHGMFLFF